MLFISGQFWTSSNCLYIYCSICSFMLSCQSKMVSPFTLDNIPKENYTHPYINSCRHKWKHTLSRAWGSIASCYFFLNTVLIYQYFVLVQNTFNVPYAIIVKSCIWWLLWHETGCNTSWLRLTCLFNYIKENYLNEGWWFCWYWGRGYWILF